LFFFVSNQAFETFLFSMENILKIALLFGIDVTGEREKKYINHSTSYGENKRMD
jgi:hypothetical protein